MLWAGSRAGQCRWEPALSMALSAAGGQWGHRALGSLPWETKLGSDKLGFVSQGQSSLHACSAGAEPAPGTAPCVPQAGAVPLSPGGDGATEAVGGAGGDSQPAGPLPQQPGVPPCMGRAEEGASARTLQLQLQGKRSEGHEVQLRAVSSPVLSINLSVPLPQSCTFTLRPSSALLAPALSALLQQGPGGLTVQGLLSIVSMCSFPLASSEDWEPETPLVPCQGRERARFFTGALPRAWHCVLLLLHSNVLPKLQQHQGPRRME